MQRIPESKRAALLAALRRFPQLELTIRRMIGTDRNFCDMCEELADAEAALSSVDQLPPHIRAARRAEWQELLERLTREIDVALQEKQAFERSRPDRDPPC